MNPKRVFMLPGWQDSDPGHWQSLWQGQYGYQKVEQHDWWHPLRGDWVARLEEALLDARSDSQGPLVLVAHSLGCHLVAAWAAHSRNTGRVGAALLVAPGDPQSGVLREALSTWWPPVLQRLPFRSVLLGSQDDPYCSLARARQFAEAWGADFVDYGLRGHINTASGLGLWPEGHAMLTDLCE
jgi:predicted alpha/beta hydrolase family esterase